MKVKSESEVAQSCLTLSDPRTAAYQAPLSYGVFQARVLGWGATAFSNACDQLFLSHLCAPYAESETLGKDR